MPNHNYQTPQGGITTCTKCGLTRAEGGLVCEVEDAQQQAQGTIDTQVIIAGIREVVREDIKGSCERRNKSC